MDEETILNSYRNVAIVGLSTDPYRPSCRVAAYVGDHGYNVLPVNPARPDHPEYADLSQPRLDTQKVEIVDIVRRPEDIMNMVEEAIKVGIKAIWMQEGIKNEEVAKKARAAGLLVVMDKCIRKEHMGLVSKPG